ncbi:hypothetical protein BC828DRAFT_374252 [Blastocladiella britannica]|nr:hypothetical protein BC828DRAFT_374252 [Blastocladiella britannica]
MPEHSVYPYRDPETLTSTANTQDIPFLPGNSFRDVFKTDYRKSHLLDSRNGYSVPREMIGKHGAFPDSPEELQALIDEATSRNADLTYGGKLSLSRPDAQPAFIPSFVAYDKVVLRFRAYFKQTVHDSTEQYLLRVVMILYYLEDDSIAVREPPQANSGILQGVLIKRQRLPKTTTELYTVKDLNNGVNVTFYGKTFHIVDCDEFTRNFMTEKLGMEVSPSEPVPQDKYLASRVRPQLARSAATGPDKLWKFLQHDRHVLRFYCKWRDAEEVRDFVMHYYLVDDCVDVKEVHRQNDGRDPCPLLLKRQPLPKSFHVPKDLDVPLECYNWSELRTGTVINVLNREFIIHDCDEFTRKFYDANLGVSMSPLDLSMPAPAPAVREFPPYNGFGSEEDSLQSCLHLVLQPPKKEFKRLQETRVLRFVAAMESRHREDKTRRFVISVYLPDEEVSIYEPPIRNNGTLGGKFLEKCRVLVPGATKQAPKYYTARDFAVGGAVHINKHTFRLLDADEYVYKFMEANAEIFTAASPENVVQKLRAAGRSAVARACLGSASSDPTARPSSSASGRRSVDVERKVPLEQIKAALDDSGLMLHEIITVYRNQDVVRQMVEA